MLSRPLASSGSFAACLLCSADLARGLLPHAPGPGLPGGGGRLCGFGQKQHTTRPAPTAVSAECSVLFWVCPAVVPQLQAEECCPPALAPDDLQVPEHYY